MKTIMNNVLIQSVYAGIPGVRGAPGAQGPPGFCEFCNYPSSNYLQYNRGNEKGP